jgi:hypothetical protein
MRVMALAIWGQQNHAVMSRHVARTSGWWMECSDWKTACAAEAIFCCPTENSRHLEAYLVSKDALFNNEKESARTMARCHVSLEKSSINYIRCENEPSQATRIASPLPHLPVKRQVLEAGFPVVEQNPPRKCAVETRHSKWPTLGERAG